MWKITPFDAEAFVMLESLTEREVLPTEWDEYFTVHVFYEKHNTPEYISAIIDAVRGRFGDRFKEVNDNADKQTLMFTIEYAKQVLPIVDGDLETGTPRPEYGDLYYSESEQIQAVQVKRDNAKRLQNFVGGGQLVIERMINGKAWFSFVNNGTYVDVPEKSYIVKRNGATHFEIWTEPKFNEQWQSR